jgi:hypothetical protein
VKPGLALDPDISWQDVDGEVVILDSRGLKYYTVNESAVPLWRLLTGGTTRDAMVELLTTTHEVERSRVEQDVDLFLDQLRTKKLLSTGD